MQHSEQQRLQKLLADAGIGSRRQIERLIVNKQIKVNGKVAELGSKASRSDRISIADKDVHLAESPTTKALVYHKPLGTIVSRSDPQARKTVFHDLPRLRNNRWISVGRLDINTSGLLLLCTDGQLAHRLMHPSSEIERTYLLRLRKKASDTVIDRLLAGVMLEDGMASFKQITRDASKGERWYKVVVAEGRNRLVRRLWSNQGLFVDRLIRIGFGTFKLPKDLPHGTHRMMSEDELTRLYKMAGLRTREF